MTVNHSYSIWQNVWYCVKRVIHQTGCRYYLPAILAMLASALLPFASAFFPSTLIRILTQGASAQTVFAIILGFVLLLGSLTLTASLARTYRDRAIISFRLNDTAVYRKLMSFSYSYLETKQATQDKIAAGRAHYSGSQQGIEKTIQCPIDIAGALLSIILYASVAASLHPFLVAVLFVCSCVQAVFISKNIPFQRRNIDQSNEIEQQYSLTASQCIQAKMAKDIRLYHTDAWFREKLYGYFKELSALRNHTHLRHFGIQSIGRLAILLRDLICYGYLIYQVTQGLDLAAFTLYLSIFAGFTGYFETIVQKYWDLADTNEFITSFRNYLEEPSHDVLTGSRPVPAGPHTFTFEDVSFCYAESDTPTLEHFNLTIGAGENLALVGLNGAGKTTLIKLLCGLYKPTAGRVLMDGIDIQEFDADSYYRAMGVVFQDDFSAAFPLSENVTGLPDGEEDDEKLWHVLTITGLADKIRSYPNHIHTRLYQDIDPNGILLSGGEMQKLMLARALYKSADTLILDEPTAALDPLAEADMYAQYHQMTQGKTSLFISHRLSSTQFCDRIIFLENGQIAEEGSHETLLRADGLYADLFRTQASYYQEEAPTL